MKTTIKLFAVAALFAACSSDDDSTIKEIKLNETETEIAANSPAFAVDLLRAVDGTFENNDKYVVSPLSASLALSMAMNGADGETYDQIADAMSLGDYSLDEINNYNKKLIDGLGKLDKQAKLTVANSVWLNEGFYPLETFNQQMIKYYAATSEVLDFSSSNAVNTINNWVSNETNGLIPQLYEYLIDGTQFVLADAFYFKCPWYKKFDVKNTKVDKFYAYDGTVQDVEFMTTKNVPYQYYSEDNKFRIFSLYLGKNKAFSMDFVETAYDVTIEECVEMLDNGKLAEAYKNSYKREGYSTFTIPKLNIDVNEVLDDALIAMGVKDAYDDKKADFSKLTDERIYLLEVRQANVFSIDEDGGEAATATGVQGGDVSAPMEHCIMNRPFLFFVRENKTNTILYAGKVNKI